MEVAEDVGDDGGHGTDLRPGSFQNFKALKAVDVDLTPFTVIVGKNGSGKTSVLQGIFDVSQVPARKTGKKSSSQRLSLIFGGDMPVQH